MSVYKSFISSDITIVPFKVNKSYEFRGGSTLTQSNVGIDRFIGQNTSGSYWISGSDNTGYIKPHSKELVYKSVKQLYYSNFVLAPFGSSVFTASFNSDDTITGEGGTLQPMYDNYLFNTLQPNRIFPTASGDRIGVISIPNHLFGEYIKPGTFEYIFTGSSVSGKITDDGNGSLFEDGKKVGDIIYQHGMIILTSFGTSITGSVYGSALYGYGVYSTAGKQELDEIIDSNNITCSFQSTLTIQEAQYKCTLRENEFTFSQNPSVVSKSLDGTIYDFATSSYFQPYITTVGLYNNNKELLAIGKLSQPLQSSNFTDTTIMINLDL